MMRRRPLLAAFRAPTTPAPSPEDYASRCLVLVAHRTAAGQIAAGVVLACRWEGSHARVLIPQQGGAPRAWLLPGDSVIECALPLTGDAAPAEDAAPRAPMADSPAGMHPRTATLTVAGEAALDALDAAGLDARRLSALRELATLSRARVDRTLDTLSSFRVPPGKDTPKGLAITAAALALHSVGTGVDTMRSLAASIDAAVAAQVRQCEIAGLDGQALGLLQRSRYQRRISDLTEGGAAA